MSAYNINDILILQWYITNEYLHKDISKPTVNTIFFLSNTKKLIKHSLHIQIILSSVLLQNKCQIIHPPRYLTKNSKRTYFPFKKKSRGVAILWLPLVVPLVYSSIYISNIIKTFS